MSEQYKPTYSIDALEAADNSELTSGQVLGAFADKRAELMSKLEEISSRPGFKLDAIGIMRKRREESQMRDELAEFERAYAELGGDAIDRAQEAVDALDFRSSAEDRARALAELSNTRDAFYTNFVSRDEISAENGIDKPDKSPVVAEDNTKYPTATEAPVAPIEMPLLPEGYGIAEDDPVSDLGAELTPTTGEDLENQPVSSVNQPAEPGADNAEEAIKESADQRFKKGDDVDFDGKKWRVQNKIVSSESGEESLVLSELDGDNLLADSTKVVSVDEVESDQKTRQELGDKIRQIDTSWLEEEPEAVVETESAIEKGFRENPPNPNKFTEMMKSHRHENESKKRRFLGVFTSASDYLFKRTLGLRQRGGERVQDMLDKRAVPGYGELSKKEKAVLALGVIGITALAYQMQRNGGDIDLSAVGDLVNGEVAADMSLDTANTDVSVSGRELTMPEGERELPMPDGGGGGTEVDDDNGGAGEESSASSQHENNSDTNGLTETLSNKFEIQNGSSFTQELIDVAENAGLKLSKSESYDLYKELVKELGVNNIVEGIDTYQIPGTNDYGLSNTSESAAWTPEAQKIIAEYFNSQRG